MVDDNDDNAAAVDHPRVAPFDELVLPSAVYYNGPERSGMMNTLLAQPCLGYPTLADSELPHLRVSTQAHLRYNTHRLSLSHGMLTLNLDFDQLALKRLLYTLQQHCDLVDAYEAKRAAERATVKESV